ncbi:MAG: hypothetical protein EAX95_13150 [Candidatus Thorarchaeota archaeon]|nr:hypothetical protein [Candidatus Thorarchaeota archaeon]
MSGLIVPGTTIGVSLVPGYVEIRDKGLVKKKIPTKHRSFYAVLEEVEMYFRSRRKMLPPGTLKDVLVRIGLPEAKKIVTEEDVEPVQIEEEKQMEPEEDEEATAVSEELADLDEPISPEIPEEEVAEAADESAEEEEEQPEIEILSSDDFQDIAEALTAVESLSDSFMAPQSRKEESEAKATSIRVSLSGASEVVSASSSFASAPKPLTSDSESEEERLDEEEIEDSEIEEALTVEKEAAPDAADEGIVASLEHAEVRPEPAGQEELEPAAVGSEPEIAWSTSVEKRVTPAHVVKPLVASKMLILGEDGVGKSSLMERAGLELTEMNGKHADKDPFVRAKVFETDNHRVKAQVWSFDDAVKSKVSRSDFYEDAEVLIIVYSASDRWSFESIDFWLKESTITQEVIPPIVIVGNKMDLVRESIEDSGDEPVTNEEGFALAEELAKRFGKGDKLHPVAYIGTSCLTEEGVTDVFRTAAQLASALME